MNQELRELKELSYQRYERMAEMQVAYREELQIAWHKLAVLEGERDPKATIEKKWSALNKTLGY